MVLEKIMMKKMILELGLKPVKEKQKLLVKLIGVKLLNLDILFMIQKLCQINVLLNV